MSKALKQSSETFDCGCRVSVMAVGDQKRLTLDGCSDPKCWIKSHVIEASQERGNAIVFDKKTSQTRRSRSNVT